MATLSRLDQLRRWPAVPEGDTVWRTAHRLNEALAGHAVTVECDLRWPEISAPSTWAAPRR